MSLSLLLDSADPAIWRKWLNSGIFNGITTNPTLLKAAGQPCTIDHLIHLSQEAKNLGCKELHIQAWGKHSHEMAKRGIALGKLSTPEMQIHVKIPITYEGSKAAKKLIESKISVTFTSCYEIKQVLIAAAIGASYIAPYLGRINDLGNNGPAHLITMQKILDRTNSSCKLLVASLRSVDEITYLTSNGIDAFTINNEISEDLFRCETTLQAFKRFEQDARML